MSGILGKGSVMFLCRANFLLAGGVLASLWASGALISGARADERTEAISKLLDEGWAITQQARQTADAQLLILQRVAPADAAALNAGWLVLMQQRRFEEAQKLIDQHLRRAPDDLTALRAKAWIQAVLKNYPAAMPTAERLSARLAATPPADDAERELHDASIGFLGRLLGYFAGPVNDAVHQLERRRLEKRISDRLDEGQRARFEEARNGVLARHLELTDESVASTAGALATAAADKERTLAEIHADRERLQDRERELDEGRRKLQSELQTELAAIDRQEQPLLQQQAQLASRLDLLNSDLLNYSSQILTWEALAAQENDPILRQQYLNQVVSLSLYASRIEADLYSLNRQVQALQGQRFGLQARRRQAQASTASQADRMSRELADLDRRDRRNAGLERRAARPVTASTSKARSLTAQAAALSTYDAFPLEAEKARLLDLLK